PLGVPWYSRRSASLISRRIWRGFPLSHRTEARASDTFLFLRYSLSLFAAWRRRYAHCLTHRVVEFDRALRFQKFCGWHIAGYVLARFRLLDTSDLGTPIAQTSFWPVSNSRYTSSEATNTRLPASLHIRSRTLRPSQSL